MDKQYADRLMDGWAQMHPKTHAILACMLGRDKDVKTSQRFCGKATITSDGFVMCNFVGADGQRHLGAFVGSYAELEENIQLVAEELSIPEEQTAALVRSWIATDYRSNHPRDLFAA